MSIDPKRRRELADQALLASLIDPETGELWCAPVKDGKPVILHLYPTTYEVTENE